MNETAVRSVVCHHTAGGANGNYPSLAIVRDGRPGLPGPLANLGLGRDGTIYAVAAGRANHAGKTSKPAYGNSHALGIEAENTGTGETWTAAQLDSYVKLCRVLIDEFRLPVSAVVGHKEIAIPYGRKIDPAFIRPKLSMAQFRGYVKLGRYKTSAVKTASAPKKTGGKHKATAKPSAPS